MGSREIPFSSNEICDICGQKGVYDFMGDYLCPACAKSEIQDEIDDGNMASDCLFSPGDR